MHTGKRRSNNLNLLINLSSFYFTLQKRLVTIDCTNGMEAEQSFLLNIITGAGIGSGTTARVFCEIKGILFYIYLLSNIYYIQEE